MSNEVFQQNLMMKRLPSRRALSHSDAVQRAGVYAWKSRNDRRDGKTHRDGGVFLSR